jgi:hypothetical protein
LSLPTIRRGHFAAAAWQRQDGEAVGGRGLRDDSLLYKALQAVEEARVEAQTGTVRSTYALRFALAYLYSRSDGKRWIYEQFWSNIRSASSHTQSGYIRGTMADTGMLGIMRSVGVVPTLEATQALRDACSRKVK